MCHEHARTSLAGETPGKPSFLLRLFFPLEQNLFDVMRGAGAQDNKQAQEKRVVCSWRKTTHGTCPRAGPAFRGASRDSFSPTDSSLRSPNIMSSFELNEDRFLTLLEKLVRPLKRPSERLPWLSLIPRPSSRSVNRRTCRITHPSMCPVKTVSLSTFCPFSSPTPLRRVVL